METLSEFRSIIARQLPARSSPHASQYLTFGAASLGLFLVLRTLAAEKPEWRPRIIASPATTLLPKLSAQEARDLPYPPDLLPCARDVQTPYGSLRVYEWGPEEGRKVLLVHGISTPCVALAGLGNELVGRGYRVMCFDLFGRGYSDAPTDLPYDSRLYTTQILLALSSSPFAWTGHANAFAIVGYSLGGGIAADFTSYFPHLVSSLVLLAPSGIMRTSHITWQSKLLYSTFLPNSLLNWFVGRRLYTLTTGSTTSSPSAAQAEAGQHRKSGNTAAEEQPPPDNQAATQQRRSSMVADPAHLVPGRPNITVANTVNWQLHAHPGFVPAFISSIRHAPIHLQHERWRIIGARLSAQKANSADAIASKKGLQRSKVLLVLGAQDPIIVRDEVQRDAQEVLGRENVEVVTLDTGHELPMSKTRETVEAMLRFWGELGEEGVEVDLGT